MEGRIGMNVDSGTWLELMYSNHKDTFRTHIKKSGSTEQIANIFTQKAIFKDLLIDE